MALGAWCSWGKKQITVSGEQKHCEPKSVNVYLGFFFLVNLCLGIGFLAFPYSFLHAGYLVAIPTLLLIVFVTWIHASWLLEVMARAQVRWKLVVCFLWNVANGGIGVSHNVPLNQMQAFQQLPRSHQRHCISTSQGHASEIHHCLDTEPLTMYRLISD